jgi:membrane fusion protein, macrolide-specific efflux system
LKKSSNLKLIIALVIVVAIGGGTYWYKREQKLQSAPKFTDATVTRETIATSVLSTGVVKPENRVEVKPSIAGRAEKVLVQEGDKIRKGQTLLIMSSTERAALLDAASARGPEELAKWEKLYRETPILAPVGGEIILRNIEEGQTFATSDLARVKVGQDVKVIADAYPDQPIQAKVGTIAREATTVNNVTTYVVKVIPKNAPEFLRSGMTANVRFQLANRENVLTVPPEAVIVENGKYMITKRVAHQEQPVRVPITIGLSDGKRTEVMSGVTEGETILISQAPAEDPNAGQAGSNPFGGPPRGMRKR